MKIAVCVKEVPDAAAPRRIDPATLRLDRSGEGALNPWDLSAVEEALRLVEAEGGEVVCVSMGPARAAGSLRKALAMGADRAGARQRRGARRNGSDRHEPRRWPRRSSGRAPTSSSSASKGADSDGAVLWAAVADRLRLPLVSQAASLEAAGGRVRVKRQTEYGYDVIEAPMPCVVAVSDAINEPRYPSLKGIMGAKKKPQDVFAVADLGLDPARWARQARAPSSYALAPPPPRGESLLIEDDGSAAEKIVDYLVENKLI